MADTTEEIFNEIVAEKQSFASLSDLMPQYNLAPPTPDNPFKKLLNDVASGSIVAVWRLMIYIVGSVHCRGECDSRRIHSR
jgi:hypothetical protein